MCCNEKIKHSFKSMNSNLDNCFFISHWETKDNPHLNNLSLLALIIMIYFIVRYIYVLFVSLVIGYVMVYHVTYTNYFSLLKFYVTGCFQYIHSWRRATIWKKVSTFEQSEYIIWIFSTTSSVKDNVLWMKCNFMLHLKN